MADKKITQLTAATTPVAGTEVLPIVQGGQTRQVSINDLTVGKDVAANRFNAANGLKAGGAAPGYVQVVYSGVADFEWNAGAGGSNNLRLYDNVAGNEKWRLNGSTGDMTVSLGNLVIGTSGKGIDFSANTGAAGMTSELLNWYEEGTATAVLTDGTNNATLAAGSGMIYTRIGRLVMVQGYIEVSNIGSVSGALRLAGLPFNVNSSSRSALSVGQSGGLAITAGQSVTGFGQANTDYIRLYVWTATTGSTQMTNTQLSTGGFISFSFNYVVA